MTARRIAPTATLVLVAALAWAVPAAAQEDDWDLTTEGLFQGDSDLATDEEAEAAPTEAEMSEQEAALAILDAYLFPAAAEDPRLWLRYDDGRVFDIRRGADAPEVNRARDLIATLVARFEEETGRSVKLSHDDAGVLIYLSGDIDADVERLADILPKVFTPNVVELVRERPGTTNCTNIFIEGWDEPFIAAGSVAVLELNEACADKLEGTVNALVAKLLVPTALSLATAAEPRFRFFSAEASPETRLAFEAYLAAPLTPGMTRDEALSALEGAMPAGE